MADFRHHYLRYGIALLREFLRSRELYRVVGRQRADETPRQSLYAGQNKSSHDAIGGVQWFNPAAFSAPQPWAWGNAARNLLFGPGYSNLDLSLLKAFSIPRLAEHSLQLRADFFNAANHFNLGNPSSTVAATQYGGAPISSTGKIFGGSGNRVVQILRALTGHVAHPCGDPPTRNYERKVKDSSSALDFSS